jgi:hypothetical protein
VWNRELYKEITYADYLRITVIDGTKKTDPYYTDYNSEKTSRSFGFILQKGDYLIEIHAYQNYRPRSPLEKALTDNPPILKITKNKSKEISAELVGLNNWLIANGLSNHIELVDIYTKGSNLDMSSSLFDFLNNRLNDVDRKSIIIMRTNLDRDDLSELEHRFYVDNGMSLWNRIFRKISLTSGLKSEELLIYLPVFCSGSMIYEGKPGVVQRYGPECYMGSSRSAIEFSIKEGFSKALIEKLTNSFDFSEEIPNFLSSFIKPPAVKIDYLSKYPNFVEVMVRGLKGEVIPGGNVWEKTQLVFMNNSRSSKEMELAVLVDGQIASGLGGFPPDSQFTKSMEPKFSESLNNYAKKISTAFVAIS